MRCRRSCREAAIQALYQCDTLLDFSQPCIELFFANFLVSSNSDLSDSESVEVTELQASKDLGLDFCRSLIFGVIDNLEFIDTQLNLAATHWSVSRMSRVDRNILRLGVYELAFSEEVPTKVVLNEAIEIAKRFGSDESAVFVNGVLDKVAASFAAKPPQIEQIRAKKLAGC